MYKRRLVKEDRKRVGARAAPRVFLLFLFSVAQQLTNFQHHHTGTNCLISLALPVHHTAAESLDIAALPTYIHTQGSLRAITSHYII